MTEPQRIRVLLLAANPASTGRLAIDEEARAIAQKIRLSRDRDTFDLTTCWAVQPGDLLQYLNEYRPHVVHFSGHGSMAGEILLSAGDGSDQPVGADALAELFRIMRDDIRVVLLNACYTGTQAKAINEHVDFVIGTRAPIADEAATVFAAAFYSALGFGRTVPQAFDQAKAAMLIHGWPAGIPELLIKPNADLQPLCPGGAMNPNQPGQGQQPPQPTVQTTGSGNNTYVSGNNNSVTNVNAHAKKGISFDTKMLLGTLVFDVILFIYGSNAYTGQNTTGDMWRAGGSLFMFGVTIGMIRRWFRRRT